MPFSFWLKAAFGWGKNFGPVTIIGAIHQGMHNILMMLIHC